MAPAPRIRRKGVAFVATGAMLIVAAAFLNRPSLALVGAVPLFLAAFLSGRVQATSVRVERRFDADQPRVEDDPIQVALSIAADTRSTRLVEVRDRLPDFLAVESGSNYGVFALSRGRPQALAYAATAPRFGLHDLGPIEVRVEDPFGLYGYVDRAGGKVTARVEPRASQLDVAQVRSLVPQAILGQHEVAQPGSGFEFFGLRDYTPADRMRDVNWKATARVGRLVVNQHVRESRADVLLLLDARGTELAGNPVHCPWAQTGRLALQVATELLGRRDSIRVVTYGARLHEERHTGGGRQRDGLVDALLTAAPEGSMPLEAVVDELLPSLAPRAPVVILSSLMEDPSASQAVLRLLAQNSPVLVLTASPMREEAGLGPSEALLLLDRGLMIGDVRGIGATVVSLEPPTDGRTGVAA